MDKKILLIADDEEMNRKIIKKFLSSYYEVIEAENGREVLETLKTRHIDALLLDIIMPEVDGLEVLKRVKEDKQYDHIGILVATSTKEKTERTALSLGADDIVSKPYDPLVIMKRLTNILAVKQLHIQKQMIKDENYDALITLRLSEMKEQLEKVVHEIVKGVELMNASFDNEKLYEELSRQVIENAQKIVPLITKNMERE